MKTTLLLLLILCSCERTASPYAISKAVEKKTNCHYDISALGGSGPGNKYDSIKVSYTVDHYLTFTSSRKQILELQDAYIEVINNNDKFKEIFTVPLVDRSNIHLGLLLSYLLENGPWEIDIIATHKNSITYMTETTIDGDWDFYRLGKETYDEALKVAYSCGPFERVITSTKYGRHEIPLELHGPWGFFIQRIVIQHIQSGEFVYYAEVNGEKLKLAVCGDEVVVEATRQPIKELFPPRPEFEE